MTCNVKSSLLKLYFHPLIVSLFLSYFCSFYFFLVVVLLHVPVSWMHGFFLLPSLGIKLEWCNSKLHTKWSCPTVRSQTPPEAVTLHCASEERGVKRCPLGPLGESVFTTRLWQGGFIYLSVWVTQFVLLTSHSFICLYMQLKNTYSTQLIKTLRLMNQAGHIFCPLSVLCCPSSVFTRPYLCCSISWIWVHGPSWLHDAEPFTQTLQGFFK